MFCSLEDLEPKEKSMEFLQPITSNDAITPVAKTTTASIQTAKANTTPLPTSPTSISSQANTPIPSFPSASSIPTLPSSPKEPVGVMDLLNKAIAEGKHAEAAQLAKEVSKSQISAKLVGSATTTTATATSPRKLSKSEKIRSE